MRFGVSAPRSKYDAALSSARPVSGCVEVPFIGALNITWNGQTRGRTWFDTAGIVSDAMNGGAEVWAGRLHILACRDTSIRPDVRTAALVAFVVAEVARWFW